MQRSLLDFVRTRVKLILCLKGMNYRFGIQPTGDVRIKAPNLLNVLIVLKRFIQLVQSITYKLHTLRNWKMLHNDNVSMSVEHLEYVFTERYRTLWFIRRTRSRMKRRPNWSIVSLARTTLAHMLERQAGCLVWGLRNTRKKWTISQLVHRPEFPGQGRALTSQPSQTMPWKKTMSSTGTRQKWSTEKHSDRPDG